MKHEKPRLNTVALPGRIEFGAVRLALVRRAVIRLLAVVNRRQFLELGQRTQGRGLRLSRAATAGCKGQGSSSYSGKGHEFDQLLHRRVCVARRNLKEPRHLHKTKIEPGATNG